MSAAHVVDVAAELAVYPPKNNDRSSPTKDEDGVSNSSNSNNEGLNASSLPPVDTGYAWVFLACAFTAEAITWGIPYATGGFDTSHSIFCLLYH